MCIIMYQPKGVRLPVAVLARGYTNNDDGWGIAAITPQGIVIQRDFGDKALDSLLATYADLAEHELIVHCRIGTSGDLSIKNTHPFFVRDGLYMFHNGILNVDRSSDKSLCDSYHAAKAIGEGMGTASTDDVFSDREYLAELTAYAGTSRLAFVHADGVSIINEHLGVWRDGAWFSNESAHSARFSAASTTFGTSCYTSSALHDVADEDFANSNEGLANDDADFLDAVSLADMLHHYDLEELRELAYSDPDYFAEAVFHRLNCGNAASLTQLRKDDNLNDDYDDRHLERLLARAT